MTPYRWLPVLALLCVACSASPSINVGNEPDGSVAGAGGSSGFGGVGGFGGGNSLTAKVTEPPSEMAIEVLVVGCAGECKQVLAVASGGNPGYAFEWNDGVTTAAREICATDDTTFTVTVRDTPSDDPEFHYEAQTVSVDVLAQVLVCTPDGGAPGDLCIENPALEGTPGINVVPGTFALPGWTDCGVFGGADVCDAALAAVGGVATPK
jgi:hypothetical protein